MASCRDELIWKYFHLGYEYKLIVCFLYYVEGISISLRQLKRILQRLGFGDGGWVAKLNAPIGWVAAGGPRALQPASGIGWSSRGKGFPGTVGCHSHSYS